jgi:hypothetical protein
VPFFFFFAFFLVAVFFVWPNDRCLDAMLRSGIGAGGGGTTTHSDPGPARAAFAFMAGPVTALTGAVVITRTMTRAAKMAER